ncbi:unnamed protein product [Mucor circinelloides]
MLVSDADQYLTNIGLAVDQLKDSINNSEIAGHIVLLTNRYNYLVKLQNHAIEELKDVVSPVEDEIEGISSNMNTLAVDSEAMDAEEEEEEVDDDDYESDSDNGDEEDVDPDGINAYRNALDD